MHPFRPRFLVCEGWGSQRAEVGCRSCGFICSLFWWSARLGAGLAQVRVCLVRRLLACDVVGFLFGV